MEKIKIGKIVNAVGLKGEVKIYNYSGYKERYEELSEIIAKDKKYKIEKVRYQKNSPIIKLQGVDDRNDAEDLKDIDVFIEEKDLVELPDDTFYIKDLIGVLVLDAETGEKLGELKDVLQNSAQDLYIVKLPDEREIIIPAVSEFIKEINGKDGFIKVKLIPGFLD